MKNAFLVFLLSFSTLTANAVTPVPPTPQAILQAAKQHMNQAMANAAKNFHYAAAAKGNLITVKCGDVVRSSGTIANDLSCSDSGVALIIAGDSITVDGGGHKISAPNAAIGILVEGNGIQVTGFNVNGVKNGFGISAYNASGLLLSKNTLTNNTIGIMLDADGMTMAGVQILNNTVTGNSLFGISANEDDGGFIDTPLFKTNDFSNSGAYAMHLKLSYFELFAVQGNKFNNSANGIYLMGGTFFVRGLDLSNSLIRGTQIRADNAAVIIKNVNVSTNMPAQADQQRIGIMLYNVASFFIVNVTANNDDVGIRIDNDNGIPAVSSSINSCTFSKQVVAGIFISTTAKSTYYQTNLLSSNSFSESNGAQNVLAVIH